MWQQGYWGAKQIYNRVDNHSIQEASCVAAGILGGQADLQEKMHFDQSYYKNIPPPPVSQPYFKSKGGLQNTQKKYQ